MVRNVQVVWSRSRHTVKTIDVIPQMIVPLVERLVSVWEV